MVYKQFQYTYCPISHKVKFRRKKILFFKNYGENEARSQVPNLFLFLKKLDMR